MKANEVRKMSPADLEKKLGELKKDLFQLRLQHATNQLENPVRISEVKRDIARVKTIIREQQLCELIGAGKSLTYSEDSPLVLLGMDENQTATYQSITVKNAELVFKGTLTESDGTESNINLFSMSADNMEALHSHVSMMQQRNKALVAEVADTYGEVFRLASGLKTHLDTPSPLYDQLDALSQPIIRDANQTVNLRQWAADALLSIHGDEPEFVRLNELTNGRFEEFASQLAEGMDDDQISMLSSEVISRRAVYSPAVLEEVYRDVVRHYTDGNAPESDATSEDLVELLGLVNSESLHSWAVNGDVRPGEYIQQLRSALTKVSVYDAAHVFDHVRQADQQAERDYVANQKSPKTDIEGRYAFVMSYFLDNYQSLTAEQKAVFHQLDHADTPDALRQWASSVRVGHALADLSDLPAAVRDEVDELAYNIAEYDEARHEELLQGFHAVGMVDDQRMAALVAISDRLHAQYPDELILFKNGNGMSAVGQDAEQVLRLTGWPANLVYFGADNYVQLTNISSDGYEVLAEKDVNLRIVNAPINMRPFRDQPFNETGYALQTIDDALSHVQDEFVLLDTNGSLNIGNFKAKTLDFHSTGLDAIADDGEKLVIRDIPTNYYHPEGTLVVADFIRGRRDTIENALDAAVPVVEQRNVEGERLSVLSDYNNQKALHPDEILLFRQKGFVEAFGEDAERLAEALQVPLYERTVEGEKTSFVMIGMSDYMDLTENATINTHVAIANVRDPRLDISQSISRMQEQIAIDPARQGFGAEIYRLDDGGYSISLVDYRSLHAISEEINLSAEEAERYAAMTGPAAMSQRSDFVIEMANKYFGERLQLEQEYSNVRQNYDAAGLLGTAILLDEPIEHRLDDGGVERFAAYTVDEGYVMLYKSMEDAEQSFDPYMLNDLDVDQQLDILSRIDLSKEGVRQQVLDNIFDKTLDDNRDVLERLKNNPVNHETAEKPYRISIGTDNRPGGVEGEFHVQFVKEINAVSFKEIQSLAEELGGSARIMNNQEWADFYDESSAVKFADKVVAINAERIVASRDNAAEERREQLRTLLGEVIGTHGQSIAINPTDIGDGVKAVYLSNNNGTILYDGEKNGEGLVNRILDIDHLSIASAQFLMNSINSVQQKKQESYLQPLTDEQWKVMSEIGYPYAPGNAKEHDNAPVPEMIYWRYAAGMFSMDDVVRSLSTTGYTVGENVERSREIINELNEKYGKLDADLNPLPAAQLSAEGKPANIYNIKLREGEKFEGYEIHFKEGMLSNIPTDILTGLAEAAGALVSDSNTQTYLFRDYAFAEKFGEAMVSLNQARHENTIHYVRELISSAGLLNSPLTPRLPVVVSSPSVSDEEKTVYAHAMVTDSDILVFENRYDCYDFRGGISLSDLPLVKQQEVLDVIKEQYGDENRQVTVLLDTQQVPEYALSAIVNGDFSGIDDPEDEKNIRDFMEREYYKGAIFSPRNEHPSFTTATAFGLPTDCVTVDILRTGTIKQFRDEYITASQDLPFPEVAESVSESAVHQELSNLRYTPEQSEYVKATLGEYLQNIVNERYNTNGDIYNTEVQEGMKKYLVSSTNTAQDAAYDMMVRILKKADVNKPGILASWGVDDIEATAEMISIDAIKAAEKNMPQESREQLSERLWSKLNELLPENGDMLLLKQPFTITEAQDLAKGQTIDVFNIRRSLSPEYDAVCVFVCGDNKGGVNTYRLTADNLHKVEAILENKDYTLSLKKDEGVEPELRDARGYLMDVISQALAEMNGHIEISHIELPSVPIKGDWQDEGNGHPFMEVIKAEHNVRDAVFYDVHAEAYPIDDVVGKLNFAETYALTVAVREAQIANLIGAGESIQWNGLAVSHDADNPYAPQMFIDSVDVDQDGKLNIQGHYIAEDGKPITVEHGTFLDLAGYDDLYAEVKTLMNIQDVTFSENLSDGISFTADDQQLIKERMTSYLQGLDSDYYGTNINIADRVSGSTFESWGDVHRLATSIGEDILRTADANDAEILSRYGIDNISHEALAIGQDTLAKAKEVLSNRDNKLFEQLDIAVAALSTMQKEYNTLRRVSDSSYMFKDVVDSYSYERNPKDPQQVALLEVKGGYANYATSWMSVSDVLSKLNARQSELINEYPQLKEFASMEEKKQDAVQQPEAQEQQEKKRPFANIDYTKYAMPEGSTVEKANVFKQTSGKDAGKYAISAIINGERKLRTLYYNDVTAFFNEKKGQDGAKATLDQLVAKYFGKSTAESMSIGSVGEAEKVRGEQEEAHEQAAAAEKKEAEAQQEQKKQEEVKKEKKDAPSAALVQSEMLIAALVAAGADHGVWLNKDGKRNPDFVQHGQVVSPFNSLMMNLHADANGYKTNQYMTFNDARKAGVSVKKGETGLPFNWYNWDKYVSRINSNDIIDKEKYDALPAEEKDLYKGLRTKEEKKIFNVDQTTMSSVAKPQYKELLEKEAKSVLGRGEKDVLVVEEGKNLYDEFKKDNPDTMLILRTGEDSFELYGADAEKAASILHIKLNQKDGEQAALTIPEKQLDNFLPKLVRDGQRVSVQNNLDKPEVLRRYGTADHIYKSVADLTEGLGKVAGDSLVISSIKNTGYDASKDLLIINDSRASVAGEEVSTAAERANDIYRAVAAYTGAADRLNRTGKEMLPEDAVKYDKLVQEVAAGVLMARQGLPATISKENIDLIPYWERELKEDPKLIERLEGDVNNTVQAIAKLRKGETVDYAAVRGEKSIEALKPKYYTIASQLATIPDMEKKQVVIVRDPANKVAAVILPSGASLEVNNEAPGLNKNRFVIALKKEGIEDVQFYNAGGALGLHQPNEFFADKTVEVAKLKQYEIQPIETINLKDEIARTSKVDIEQVSMIRDDDNKHVLYVKPAGGEAFTIYPNNDDIRAFFANLKDPAKFDAIRENLGQKYYAFVQRHPEFKANVLMPDINADLDISRITKVNIVKDKNKEKSYIMFATIDGESQKPREVSGVQAQRMWLVDDKDMYKLRLAAILFEDKLGLSEGQAAAQFRDNNEGQGVDNAPDAPEQEDVEEQQETRRGGFHR